MNLNFFFYFFNSDQSLTGPIQYVYLRTPKSGVYFLAIFTSADASSLLKAKSAVHKRALADSLVVKQLIEITYVPLRNQLADLLSQLAPPPAADLHLSL